MTMMKQDPAIERLLTEFSAQDCSTLMKVFYKGEHILVARFSDENQVWLVTPEGRALLDPPTEPTPEPEPVPVPKMSVTMAPRPLPPVVKAR